MPNHPLTIINSHWFDKTREIKNIPQPCNIMVDDIISYSNTLPNIFIQVEPNIIINNEHYLLNNFTLFHTIFTYNENLLHRCPNAKFCVVGTTWIDKNFEIIDISKKQFKISTLVGAKIINNSIGHILRHLIHHAQTHILKDCPITYFRSSHQLPHIKDYGGNPLLGTSKMPLFEEFKFAIVIENTRECNCFSEKIMDCILTKTIPIYWGCSNIDKFFDISGWIILETGTVEELSSKITKLSDDYYDNYKHIIDKNFTEALKYVDMYDNINNAI